MEREDWKKHPELGAMMVSVYSARRDYAWAYRDSGGEKNDPRCLKAHEAFTYCLNQLLDKARALGQASAVPGASAVAEATSVTDEQVTMSRN